ncbi:hypothetical protein [Nocardioides sp. Root151]|uniref:hypothetical protein n=1 Tax=Nocardioides sp. Root151 TaxID=1736475 RepID=UPI000702422A|nr:hypothetical protein [Nocardioides sp. Root151]KQZ67620.1 hypothetical protein ASD66_22160 [Nocardioides sp. Root151]
MRETIAPRHAILGVLAGLVVLVLTAGIVGHPGTDAGDVSEIAVAGAAAEPGAEPGKDSGSAPVIAKLPTIPALPHGGTRVFDGRMLVAYYGTAGTPVLGVLGETSPEQAIRRVRRAARPFDRPGKPAVPVMELIVTVADGHPGPGRDFSHDIDHSAVAEYVRAARRHKVMLVLDLQTGRSDFLKVAKRWEWALKHPWVGLALDPEWRMGRGDVPGRRIGSVNASEVNRTSAWLEGLVRRERLPQKIFMLHQFRREMIRGIDRVRARPHLAMVQHVDGFGTPGQKMSTYLHVARAKQFHMGFKLFYDEDIRRMSAAKVLRIRPRVQFVSFQ